LSQRVLDSALRVVESMLPVNHEDRAQHHDDDADRADANENPRQHRQAAAELRESHQVADYRWGVHESCKLFWTGTTKGSKQNCTAVVQKDDGAAETKDKQSAIDPRSGVGLFNDGRIHGEQY
jgi:hypothetical protein